VSVREVVPPVLPEAGSEASRGVVAEHGGRRWVLRDRHGCTAALAGPEESRWKLAALSGGHSLQVLGEWSAEAVTPLGAWVEDRMVVL
jgi:hypothetical protein